MNTPKTNAILASQPNGGFGLDKSQCIAQWHDHARQLETQVQELRGIVQKYLDSADKPLGMSDLAEIDAEARAILEKTS